MLHEERCVARLDERIAKAIKRGRLKKALELSITRNEIQATYDLAFYE